MLVSVSPPVSRRFPHRFELLSVALSQGCGLRLARPSRRRGVVSSLMWDRLWNRGSSSLISASPASLNGRRPPRTGARRETDAMTRSSCCIPSVSQARRNRAAMAATLTTMQSATHDRNTCPANSSKGASCAPRTFYYSIRTGGITLSIGGLS